MINRVFTLEKAAGQFLKSAQTWMIGGFGRGGTPFTLLEYVSDRTEQFQNLTLIKNDANEPDLGIGTLLKKGMVKKLISTHIGLNPEFIDQMNRGEVECQLMPQGIFAECIRAGGAGIPAILSDIGIGTEVEENKTKVQVDGKTLLVEKALHADVALVCADVVDKTGNAWFRGSNRNMCVIMGTASDRVIVEAKEIVEIGEIESENIHLPGVFVDAVVQAQPRRHQLEKA